MPRSLCFPFVQINLFPIVTPLRSISRIISFWKFFNWVKCPLLNISSELPYYLEHICNINVFPQYYDYYFTSVSPLEYSDSFEGRDSVLRLIDLWKKCSTPWFLKYFIYNIKSSSYKRDSSEFNASFKAILIILFFAYLIQFYFFFSLH